MTRAETPESPRKRRRWLWAAAGVILASAGASAYAIYHFVDENFHAVVEGQVYRSAQPGPKQLEQWSREYHLRTVVNLRGDTDKDFHTEEEQAAARLGLKMEDVRFSAVKLPSVLALRELVRVLETAERPMLLHCRGGADRTGLASVMAAMAVGGADYATARSQMSMMYLHFDRAPKHIEGVLRLYEDSCRKKGHGTGGWREFRQWLTEDYHREFYFVGIDVPERLEAKPGQTITVEVAVTNRSAEAIPSSDPAKTFTLSAFTGSSLKGQPDSELGGRTPLPKENVAPGARIVLKHQLVAPSAEGTYEVHFDLVHELVTWFGRQGSPVPTTVLVVRR